MALKTVGNQVEPDSQLLGLVLSYMDMWAALVAVGCLFAFHLIPGNSSLAATCILETVLGRMVCAGQVGQSRDAQITLREYLWSWVITITAMCLGSVAMLLVYGFVLWVKRLWVVLWGGLQWMTVTIWAQPSFGLKSRVAVAAPSLRNSLFCFFCFFDAGHTCPFVLFFCFCDAGRTHPFSFSFLFFLFCFSVFKVFLEGWVRLCFGGRVVHSEGF